MPLTTVFKHSVQLDKVPKDWKQGSVIPFLEKGNRSRCAPLTYMPINLMSRGGKVPEKDYQRQACKVPGLNNLLFRTQHGFRNKRCCLTNVLDCLRGVEGQFSIIADHGIEDPYFKVSPLSSNPKPSDDHIHSDIIRCICSASCKLFALQG